MSQEVEVVKQQPVVDAGLGDDPETKLSQSCCGCGKVGENILVFSLQSIKVLLS